MKKLSRVMAPFQHDAYAKIQRSFIFLKNEMRMGFKMLCFAYMSNIPLINHSNELPPCSFSVIQIVQGKVCGSTPKGRNYYLTTSLVHVLKDLLLLSRHLHYMCNSCAYGCRVKRECST